ncbi:MAG: alpha/beta fold hydrolase [Streptomycetaceae bacterium]|jgi:pimeloyl-ACP methyl ester carboxylesterase|nr:alpha/beta fold hydrolase [Streptomycetaceae bacterium]
MPRRTSTTTSTTDAVFHDAYADVLATRWPAEAESATVDTPFGSAHVISYGRPDAPPLVLLPGGGATATAWFATAAALGTTHRVHAVDTIGEPGRSTAAPGRPVTAIADQLAWLDHVLDGATDGSHPVALAGHSYGAWTALHYALHAPERLRALALLDPTNCFTGYAPGFLLRALPVLLRPSPARNRAWLHWETRNAALDPAWVELYAAGATFPSAKPLTGPRPDAAGIRVPTFVALAADSRAHDPRKVARAAEALVPDVRTTFVPGTTHYSLAVAPPPQLLADLADFLTDRPATSG